MTSPSSAVCAAVRASDVAATRAAAAALSPSDPWPCDDDGHSALHWAAMSDEPAIMPLVLSLVSPTRLVDVRATAAAQEGQTPLHWACVSGNTPAVLALLSSGADPATTDAKSYSSATHAVHYGRVDLLHVLSSQCPALMSMTDREGHTLLQWAAYYDHVGVVAYLLKVWCVDPSEPDASGMTPLHRAAQCGHAAVTEHLLRAGADCTARDASGKTPEELVKNDGRTKAVLRMWAKGILSTAKPVRSRHRLPKYSLVLFYWILVTISYILYRQLLNGAMSVGVKMNIFLHLALIVSAIAHLAATFGDPGDIRRGTPDDFKKYIEAVLADGVSETALVPSAYCFTCLVPRPPRSKHSRERDACVRRFDHECPWINNTVGLHTHKALLLLVVSVGSGEWAYIYLIVKNIAHSPGAKSAFSVLLNKPFLFMVVAMHSCISIFCVMLLLTHVRLILRGETTYEHLSASQNKLNSNPYDMGWKANLTSFITSTGSGTGKSLITFSAATLREVVMASDSNMPKPGTELERITIDDREDRNDESFHAG